MYCCSAGYSVETCSSVVFNIEVKPYLAVLTLYSCFDIFMTYWAYVLCYFVFCLSFVPDLTNFELLVIDLRIYLFLYLCFWFLVFLLFFIHFDCNYRIFFTLPVGFLLLPLVCFSFTCTSFIFVTALFTGFTDSSGFTYSSSRCNSFYYGFILLN